MRTSSITALLALTVCALPAQERSTRNPYTSADDIAAGARLYRPLCSNCHGQEGQGWPGFTPNLAGGLHYADQDIEVFDILTTGIAGTDMPAFTLSDRETWQLVSFVRSFAREREVSGDAVAGAALFRERGCARCHQPGGSGPDLRDVAAVSSPDDLREAILHPNNEVHPRRYRVQATTSDGRRLEGVRLNEDSFSAQIRMGDGRLVSLDKTQLRDFEVVKDSAMPSFEDRLSDEELDSLVAYLMTLAGGE